MNLTGKVWKFGDDVNTDEIIPARYLNLTDGKKLAEHVMEDADAEFPSKVKPGDIIVAGKNFGCGSSREHAPLAIKSAGVTCVVAKSFARIFFRNAFNTGLLILESEPAVNGTEEGDVIEIDTDSGTIVNKSKGESFQVAPVPPFMQELLGDGGLVPHLRKKMAEERS